MTKGEKRVGIGFNPSGNEAVDRIKRQAADLIDGIECIAASSPAVSIEVGRLKDLAQTAVESAAMWAVKAATKRAE